MSVNYDFAHRALRDFAFADPATLLEMLSVPEGLEALARVWNKFEEAAGSPTRVAGKDFASYAKPGRDGKHLGVLRLPHAKGMCDVLYAVLLTDPTRFFTLEVTMRGSDLSEQGNVLCGWSREGEGFGHANYGDEVLEPNFERVEKAVRSVALRLDKA